MQPNSDPGLSENTHNSYFDSTNNNIGAVNFYYQLIDCRHKFKLKVINTCLSV